MAALMFRIRALSRWYVLSSRVNTWEKRRKINNTKNLARKNHTPLPGAVAIVLIDSLIGNDCCFCFSSFFYNRYLVADYRLICANNSRFSRRSHRISLTSKLFEYLQRRSLLIQLILASIYLAITWDFDMLVITLRKSIGVSHIFVLFQNNVMLFSLIQTLLDVSN